MTFSNLIVPEVLHDFNVYDGDGNQQIGITDEMSLAEIASKTATVSGAGIMGSYDVPIPGHFDSITQEIPFRVLYCNLAQLCNPMKIQTVNVRGALQVTNRSTMTSEFVSFRYMIKGRCKSLTPGSVKPGDVMGAKISIEAIYVLIEIDSETMIEIDKLNGIYKVDGVDLLEDARKMC